MQSAFVQGFYAICSVKTIGNCLLHKHMQKATVTEMFQRIQKCTDRFKFGIYLKNEEQTQNLYKWKVTCIS